MPNIKAIISEIDKYIERTGQDFATPAEVNKFLVDAELMNDEETGMLLNIRDVLRDGSISHAFQENGSGSKWIIPHSTKNTITLSNYSKASKHPISGSKGKRTFTKTEVEEIKNLIRKKLEANPTKQKGIRQKMRDIGFYYSDFDSNGHRYDIKGFEYLIFTGQIKVKS